eukprot:CAMPEP_0170420884 /NCGR_PEP_ID=MMETSP0117_2-20130122/35586_1 /TAXON_ID=400756 /ORGANISM="Durinskia baltica, Strain CSIRO CS-38" /LENGTH=65 /DNA_ID=CAMNT_0010679363 /DNA_START=263 /DNA_END=457 /DNA_ORIENTATION=-
MNTTPAHGVQAVVTAAVVASVLNAIINSMPCHYVMEFLDFYITRLVSDPALVHCSEALTIFLQPS